MIDGLKDIFQLPLQDIIYFSASPLFIPLKLLPFTLLVLNRLITEEDSYRYRTKDTSLDTIKHLGNLPAYPKGGEPQGLLVALRPSIQMQAIAEDRLYPCPETPDFCFLMAVSKSHSFTQTAVGIWKWLMRENTRFISCSLKKVVSVTTSTRSEPVIEAITGQPLPGGPYTRITESMKKIPFSYVGTAIRTAPNPQ